MLTALYVTRGSWEPLLEVPVAPIGPNEARKRSPKKAQREPREPPREPHDGPKAELYA